MKANIDKKLDKLFDICSCECKLEIVPCNERSVNCRIANCTKIHVSCSCDPHNRVPIEERNYLRDQRLKCQPKGSFQLGSPEGKIKTEEKHVPKKPCTSATLSALQQSTAESSPSPSADECCDNDDLYEGPMRSKYNLLKTPRFALEVMRAGISLRAGAALYNALIQDLRDNNLLEQKQCETIDDIYFDHFKMKSQMKSVAIKSVDSREAKQQGLVCLGVDGKVDNKTLTFTEVEVEGEKKLKQGVEKEHHLVFTSESGELQGSYLTHTTLPLTGQMGELMARETEQVLKETKSLESIKAILCDNTNSNTGNIEEKNII